MTHLAATLPRWKLRGGEVDSSLKQRSNKKARELLSQASLSAWAFSEDHASEGQQGPNETGAWIPCLGKFRGEAFADVGRELDWGPGGNGLRKGLNGAGLVRGVIF